MAAVHVVREKPIPDWKRRVVEELVAYFKEYPVVGFADLAGMPTRQLQQIRKKFRGEVVFKVAKKNLILLAAKSAGIDPDKIRGYVTGNAMLLFTRMNPFKMARLIDRERIPVPAKPGQVAEREIVIPEGDTGIQPGPMLSVFGKLKIPYEVRKGTVYVKKDTVVAKPGDTISPELAGLLQQLGIMPFEIGLKLAAVYDGGVIIPREQLLVDLEAFKGDVLEAAKEALGVAVEIVYLPVPEAVESALLSAEQAVKAVTGETGFLTSDVAEYVVGRAESEALAVIAALGGKAKELGIEEVPKPPAPAAAAPAGAGGEEKKEEKKEEEEAKEVDISEGLGGLFGF